MELKMCVREFFNQYLPKVKGVSDQTIDGYKYAFKLFLPFAAKYLKKNAGLIHIEDITTDLVLIFLDELEDKRGNTRRTRNTRLSAIKSMCRMIRLMHPDNKDIADRILNIPQKREQKNLVGFLNHDEILEIFQSVDICKNQGFRDYTMLHLLFDGGLRASEIAGLKIDDFNPLDKTLAVLGKGNKYRLIQLENFTVDLIKKYITDYRPKPRPMFEDRLFVNQRKEGLTRHGVHRLCAKYIQKVIPEKRLKKLSAAHCFRHSCAVHMMMTNCSIADIKNHLGHENIETTSIYLKLDMSRRKTVQERFIKYMKSSIKENPKIDELIDWENKEEIIDWLDHL